MEFSVAQRRLQIDGQRVAFNNGSLNPAQTALFAVALFGEQTHDWPALQRRMMALGAAVPDHYNERTGYTQLRCALRPFGWTIDQPRSLKHNFKVISYAP